MLNVFVADKAAKKEYFFLKSLLSESKKTIGLGFQQRYSNVIDKSEALSYCSLDSVPKDFSLAYVSIEQSDTETTLNGLLKKTISLKPNRVIIDDFEKFNSEDRKMSLKTLCKSKVEFYIITDSISSIDFMELISLDAEMISHTISLEIEGGKKRQVLKQDSQSEEVEIFYTPEEVDLFSHL